jgi:ATP/maltotriose-dependent transcriptional regulator MalT
MSIECGTCERDMRGGHDEACPHFTPYPKEENLMNTWAKWSEAILAASVAVAWFDRESGRAHFNARAASLGCQNLDLSTVPRVLESQGHHLLLQLETESLLLYIEQQQVSKETALERLKERFGLKPQELRMVWGVYLGRSNNEISADVGIPVGSVKSSLFRAYNRMGVENRAGAARAVAELLGGAQVMEGAVS